MNQLSKRLIVELGVNAFKNAIGAHYLPHSSEYVAPPSIDIVRKWFQSIGYEETVFVKGTLKKSLLPPRVSEDTKPGAQPEHKKHSTSSKQPSVSSKEATKANSITEVDPGKSTPSDFIPQQQGMKEGTKNTSYDHLFACTDSHVLPNQTQSVSDGLETVLNQSISDKGASNIAKQIKEVEASSIIKLDDLAKLVEEDEKADKDRLHDTSNIEPKDASAPKSSSSRPSWHSTCRGGEEYISNHHLSVVSKKVAKNANLTKQHLKLTPTPTTTIIPSIITTTTTQIQPPSLQHLPKISSQPEEEHIKKDTRKKAISLEEAKKKSTRSDSDDETHLTEEKATAEAAKRESEVRKEELVVPLGPEVVNKYYNEKLQYDIYCDKILNRRTESSITNCDILTKKGPITLKVYREDGTNEVIPNFKASDLHLSEWRKVINACPNRTDKG
nr:hypothetical protein [Tanacetum cinerariifolium]